METRIYRRDLSSENLLSSCIIIHHSVIIKYSAWNKCSLAQVPISHGDDEVELTSKSKSLFGFSYLSSNLLQSVATHQPFNLSVETRSFRLCIVHHKIQRSYVQPLIMLQLSNKSELYINQVETVMTDQLI